VTTNQLDLSGSLQGQVSITPDEHPDDRAARIRKEDRAAFIEDCKGVAVFGALLVSIIIVGMISAYEAIFDANASADTRRWAQTVLSSLVTGSVSFVIGRKVGK